MRSVTVSLRIRDMDSKLVWLSRKRRLIYSGSFQQLRSVNQLQPELDYTWIIDKRLVYHTGLPETRSVVDVIVGREITMAIQWVEYFGPEFQREPFRKRRLLHQTDALAGEGQDAHVADDRRRHAE